MPRSSLYALLALFFLALAPLASGYVAYHPDERHYTDGAMQMLVRGDLFTPLMPDGTPRFRKPILPYWVVASSYEMFGISPWTSRFPFLIAGCAMVWMTYQLAKLLTNNESTSILAALVAMCNPLVVLSSTRSIPDILLCLFLLISAYGFVGLIAKQSTKPLFYWAAYIGAGLAAASKGLPAVVFVGFVWLFLTCYERNWNAWKKLWHTPSIATGAAIGGAWFAGVFWIHGTTALSVFWSDQVADRFEVDVAKTPLQFILAWLACAATFLPWLIPAVAGLFFGKRPTSADASFDESRRRFYLMTTFWTLTLVISMALVIKFSTRYLMPVLPLWTVVVADMIGRGAPQVVSKWFRAIAFGLVGLWAVVAFGAIVADVEMELPLLAAIVGASSAAVLAAVWLAARAFGEHADRLRVAGLLLMGIPVLLLGLKPIVLPEQGERIAMLLRDEGLLENTQIHYVGKPALAGKIRVQTDGAAQLDQVEYLKQQITPKHDIVLIANPDTAKFVDLDDYELERIPTGIGELLPRNVCWAIACGELEELLAANQKDVILARRKGAERVGRISNPSEQPSQR